MKNTDKFLLGLSQFEHPKIDCFFEEKLHDIELILNIETDIKLLTETLRELKSSSHAIPEKTIHITRKFLARFGMLIVDDNITLLTLNDSDRDELLDISLDIFNDVRYSDEELLEYLLELSLSSIELLREKSTQILKHIAQYHIIVYKQLKLEPQIKILNRIQNFKEAQLRKYFIIVNSLLHSILSLEIQGTERVDYKTISLNSAIVPFSNELKLLRSRTLTLLEKMYSVAECLNEKKMVISTMEVATRLPMTLSVSDDIKNMVTNNTKQVLNFIKGIIPLNCTYRDTDDLQLIQKIEHDVYWRHYHCINEDIAKIAIRIKELIDSIEEYQIYKLLVGFEGIFVEDWTKRDPKQVIKNDELRESKAKEFAESITEDNFYIWSNRIAAYAQIESNDMAFFPYFGKMLFYFGETSPLLALELAREKAHELQWAVTPILSGVWKTEYKQDGRQLMLAWVKDGRYLYESARVIQHSGKLDQEILSAVIDAASNGSEESHIALNQVISSIISCSNQRDIKTGKSLFIKALNQVISSIISCFNQSNTKVGKSLFVKVINILSKHQKTDWINSIWFTERLGAFFDDFSEVEIALVLDNMLSIKEVNTDVEYILMLIAKLYPQAVIKYFVKRLGVNKENTDYEAIPYSFNELYKPLSTIPNEAVDIVSDLYANKENFRWGGAKLLSIIFPQFSDGLENKLITLIDLGGERNLHIVLAILYNYQGEKFIHNVCKSIIKAYDANKKLFLELFIILSSTGVVSGYYGFVEAYQGKKEEIKPWLEDTDPKVRDFAVKYNDYLEERIKSETQRADEDVELMKYQYGDSDSE